MCSFYEYNIVEFSQGVNSQSGVYGSVLSLTEAIAVYFGLLDDDRVVQNEDLDYKIKLL